jgi:hypothetical protein
MMLYIAKLGLHVFLLAVSGNVPSLGIVQQHKSVFQILQFHHTTEMNNK